MTGPAVGSQAWLTWMFQARARDDIFDGHAPAVGVPLLVLLGGQPAAGKTTAQEAVLAANPGAGLVPITGDDLREYHPDYRRLSADAPLEMPAVTAPVSGGLVHLALDHALANRYSVLLEGTFRDSAMVAGNAERFAEAGYRVEVVAVAAPAAVSRLSAEQRSLADAAGAFGRWTPPEA
ncbi:MAG: zeta toxin family protein, partial [Propionibacteriaceae bacterium]|nr:zeta toxin family protein [Propionibacteriaceae bacterium]